MSGVFLFVCCKRPVLLINVNKFEVRLLPSSHLKKNYEFFLQLITIILNMVTMTKLLQCIMLNTLLSSEFLRHYMYCYKTFFYIIIIILTIAINKIYNSVAVHVHANIIKCYLCLFVCI